MTTAQTSPPVVRASDLGDAGRRVALTRAPAAVRVGLMVLAVAMLGGAVYLWVERGPALLLDLAHMGARFLCL